MPKTSQIEIEHRTIEPQGRVIISQEGFDALCEARSALDSLAAQSEERLDLYESEIRANAVLRLRLEASRRECERLQKIIRETYQAHQTRAAEIWGLVEGEAARSSSFSLAEITCEHEDCLNEGGDGFVQGELAVFCPAHNFLSVDD